MPRINKDKKNSPHPIDVYIGNQIRSLRLMKGCSQNKLAASVGLTFQQIQKYENGKNRVSVSRLCDISRVLNVSIEIFLTGLQPGKTDAESTPSENILLSKEASKLIRAYSKIKSPDLRKRILSIVQALTLESHAPSISSDLKYKRKSKS